MESVAQSSLLLLSRAQKGDASAMDELLRRYLPRLRRWASGRLPPRARDVLDTDDVVQDTMLRAIRNVDHVEIRGDGALQAYLRQAVTNRLADAYRQAARRPPSDGVTSNIPAAGPSPLEHAIGRDALDRYERELKRLNPEDREAIVLRIELCYDYVDIAVMLHKSSAASARMAVSRALARLSRAMRNGR